MYPEPARSSSAVEPSMSVNNRVHTVIDAAMASTVQPAQLVTVTP